MINLYLIMAFFAGFFLYRNPPPFILLYAVGCSVFIAGNLGRYLAIKYIKHSYSQFIEPIENGILVTHGMYTVIRHPLYMFYIMESMGLLLIYSNLYSFFAFICLVITIALRIIFEEKELVGKYKDEYLNYQKRTKRIIPFLY